MAEQIFISYRRSGGDIYAKSICEALKNRGFTVFYDIDSIHGGYFDDRILDAIAGCSDFLLVLPPSSLDRCASESDWVRMEIVQALKHNKNIVPVLLPGFTFPTTLPDDIAAVSRYNGVSFVMEYFDAVVDAIVKRLTARAGEGSAIRGETPTPAPQKTARKSTAQKPTTPAAPPRNESEGLTMVQCEGGYKVTGKGTCTDKNIIVIPRMHQGKPVVAIGDSAFSRYRAPLQVIGFDIPDTVVSIGQEAFFDLSIGTLTLPRSLREIHPHAFMCCHSISQIKIDEQNPYYCVKGKSLYTKDMKTLIRYAYFCEPGTYTAPESVLHVSDYAFSESNFEGINLPDGLQTIGAFAFRLCKRLRSVTLPQNVKSIGEGAFWGCDALQSVTLPTGTVRIESGTFSFCRLLSSVTLPKGLEVIGTCAFDGCSRLQKIDIPASVTEIGREAFKGCTAVQDIFFRGTKKEWKKVHIGDDAFKDVPPRVIHCSDGDIHRWFI